MKGGEVATFTSPRILTNECAAYGAPANLPLQEMSQTPDYEVITDKNAAYSLTQPGQGDEPTGYENAPSGYEIVCYHLRNE